MSSASINEEIVCVYVVSNIYWSFFFFKPLIFFVNLIFLSFCVGKVFGWISGKNKLCPMAAPFISHKLHKSINGTNKAKNKCWMWFACHSCPSFRLACCGGGSRPEQGIYWDIYLDRCLFTKKKIHHAVIIWWITATKIKHLHKGLF